MSSNFFNKDISIKTILKTRVTLYTIEMKYLLIAILLLGAVSAQAYNDDVEAGFENDLTDLDAMTKDLDFDNEDDFLEDAQDEEDPFDFEDDMEDEFNDDEEPEEDDLLEETTEEPEENDEDEDSDVDSYWGFR